MKHSTCAWAHYCSQILRPPPKKKNIKKIVYAYTKSACLKKCSWKRFVSVPNHLCKIQVGKWRKLQRQPSIGCLCTCDLCDTPAVATVLQYIVRSVERGVVCNLACGNPHTGRSLLQSGTHKSEGTPDSSQRRLLPPLQSGPQGLTYSGRIKGAMWRKMVIS